MVRTLLARALAAGGALALGAAILPVAAQEEPPPEDTVPAEEPEPEPEPTTTTTAAVPDTTEAPATTVPDPPPPTEPAPPPTAAAIVVEELPAAPEAKKDDPPGNNGTVKVDGIEFDSHPDNQPHVGCTFQIDFYGFDEGDLNAAVTFEAVPPTAGGVLLTDSVFIGEDPAGGGTDSDASATYNLSAALAGIEPHPVQGHHVKLTVNAEGSIGSDTKHKVFWVEGCGGTTTTTTSTTTTTVPDTTTTTKVPETTTTVPGSTTTVPGSTTTMPAAAGSIPPGAPPAVEHFGDDRPVPAPPAPKPVSEAKDEDLPKTGSDVSDLVLTALALVGAGAALVAVGRRRIAKEGTSR